MNLATLNQLPPERLQELLHHCCGAQNWVTAMAHFQPFASTVLMHDICDTIWSELDEDDYLEAFSHHPMIGDLDALREKFADTG